MPTMSVTMSTKEFSDLRDVIYKRSGIAFQDSKKYVLESRLARRLEELELESFDQYVKLLTMGPFQQDEFQEMFNRITINETSFFRNEPQLQVFESQALTKLLEARKTTKRLRIWSAACSTGEEPYTLAMQVHRTLGVRLADWHVEILGTDISERCLMAAQKGTYTQFSFRSVNPLIIKRYFKEVGNEFQIDPQIQQMVTFELHNLHDTLAARRHGLWDVIFCRNVMIYFDDEMKNRCAKMFHDQLAQDGYLFIGHSETLRNTGVSLTPLPISQAFAYTKQLEGGAMEADLGDPGLLNDFLTEASELIEQLDADLVRLEGEPRSLDLLNQIFRALHTIKGAASFLALGELTTFSHAAEDTLNRLRKGEVLVDAGVIDAMLKSVDVVRGMLGELQAGQALTPGPAELVERLHAISSGASNADSDHAHQPTTAGGGAGGTSASASLQATPSAGAKPLALSSEKADLVSSLADELRIASGSLLEVAAKLLAGGPDVATDPLAEVVNGLTPTVEYFALDGLVLLLAELKTLQAAVKAGDAGAKDSLENAAAAIKDFAGLLDQMQEPLWDAPALHARIAGDPANDEQPSASEQEPIGAVSAVAGGPDQHEHAAAQTSKDSSGPVAKGDAPKSDASKGDAAGETTVRVEVGRLEILLNLVGEMVLIKNQVLGIARQLRGTGLPHDLMETVVGVSGQLDRLTSELQVGVMRTRMQPLSKLFGRYPRVVRDLARVTGKQINIDLVGGDTEVDKSVLEQLSDPMVHILRNSADHGIELPQDRVAAGKPAVGTIRVIAAHRGGHVCVQIIDDGKGVDPDVVGRKAVQKGVITEEQRASMSSQELVDLIFAPGFSTAEKVSDLSGRGVGMDVVRTNIQKLGGTVSVTSVKGRGTTIEVLIPLTVAILPAMMVGIGVNRYALPVASVVEIVRLSGVKIHSVGNKPVMRLRESVLPLVDLPRALGDETSANGKRFAVVVEVGQQRAGLVVDELIGQQEIVIKPLDDAYASGGPFSGATIGEDGDVSLIIDAAQLVRDGAAVER